MSSIALPGITAATAGTEAELVREASRSSEVAFAELYRRHAQTAWRLAQAVALTRPEAEASVAEGFVRALRVVRRRQAPADEPFRPLVLAGVYHAGIDRLRRGEQPVVSVAGSGDHPALAASFRSLPERWRAALWLSQVEGLAADRIGSVLGVSAAVATQLADRGQRGLVDRLRQAGVTPPELIGPELRVLAAALPTSLAQAATTRWKRGIAADHADRFLPSLGWLGERVSRPVAGVIGGLLALGLIGLGVIGQGPLGTTNPPSAAGPPPAVSSFGVVQHGSNGFFTGPGGLASAGGASNFMLGLGGSGPALPAGGSLAAANTGFTAPGATPATPVASAGGGGATPGGGTPSGGGPSTPPPSTPPPSTAPPTTSPSTTRPGLPGTTLPPLPVTLPPLPGTTLPTVSIPVTNPLSPSTTIANIGAGPQCVYVNALGSTIGAGPCDNLAPAGSKLLDVAGVLSVYVPPGL